MTPRLPLVAAFLAVCLGANAGVPSPVHLRTNYLESPLGVDDPAPRLSWQLAQTDMRGVSQAAYRIEVASTPGGQADLWDSGRVASSQTTQIPYGGKPLTSRARAFWRVTAWDQSGATSTSPETFWETGLLRRDDWQARWIGGDWFGSGESGVPAPFLRTRFQAEVKPVSARLYVTALGVYEAYLNGIPVSADRFAPGWTSYRKRVQYQVYDVSELLREGINTFSAVLGDGWYCGHVAQEGRQRYGDRPRFLAQLELRFADGSQRMVATGPDWEVAPGPILENDFLMGESHDARQDLVGWLDGASGDPRWRKATVFDDPGIQLSPTLTPLVRAHEDLKPIAPARKLPGWGADAYVFDFGQNLVGNVTLRVKAPAGTTFRIRFAEVLDEKEQLYTENLRTARATDYYTCRGDPNGETWTSRFTFHGFRYAEVSGFPRDAALQPDTLTAHVLHSVLPEAGTFVCSDPLLNQLQRNIQWGQRGNYVEVPTDCPQRDERLGWTGDAQAFIRTGAWNRSVATFFTKWQRDIADAQAVSGAVPAVVPSLEIAPGDGGPAWADAAVICPWTVYQVYGDTDLLARHYDSLVRFVDFIGTQSRDGIRVHPDLNGWGGFGDWLALDGSGLIDGGTPKDLIGTAFYVNNARMLATMARSLGKTADSAKYDALAAEITRAFQRRYVTADGLVSGNTQTSYVLALHFDLVPTALRPKLVEELVRDIRKRGNKLSTGFVGTPYLLHVLSREGRLDVAYELLMQKQWPSWLYAVTQGATTIWERWDGWTKDKGFQDAGMNSFNHYAYGAVGDWLYRVVAGIEIDPAHPGYSQFLLQPKPGGPLTSAKATHLSPHGLISSAWEMSAKRFVWEVVVPPNARASVTFPVPASATIAESGVALEKINGVSDVRRADEKIRCQLGSGTYRFEATW
jgi:alpha-L-rhamnosidase